MKIFGIGLSRTGTTSLNEALNMLGYRSFNFPQSPEFLALSRDEFDALTDTPVNVRYRELDILYPDSKFILTDRPLNDWLESCSSYFPHRRKPYNARKQHVIEANLDLYGVSIFHDELFRQTWYEHREGVFEYFLDRPDDLLVLNICDGDGWGKLCPFLGKEIPNEPFPHLNKRRK